MGDGSLHAKGIRLCVADTRPGRRRSDCGVLSQGAVRAGSGGHSAGGIPGGDAAVGAAGPVVASGRLREDPAWAPTMSARDGFRGFRPRSWRRNDPAVYGAFLRGLFEADGTVAEGVPSMSTAHETFAGGGPDPAAHHGPGHHDQARPSAGGAAPSSRSGCAMSITRSNFDEMIGFIGERKDRLMVDLEPDAVGEEGLRLPARGTYWTSWSRPGHAAP